MRDFLRLYIPEGCLFILMVLVGYLLFFLATGCATEPDQAWWGFRLEPSCDGLGPTRFTVDDIDRATTTLPDRGQIFFEVTPGERHTGRAQQLTQRLLFFPDQTAFVAADDSAIMVLDCPGGTQL